MIPRFDEILWSVSKSVSDENLFNFSIRKCLCFVDSFAFLVFDIEPRLEKLLLARFFNLEILSSTDKFLRWLLLISGSPEGLLLRDYLHSLMDTILLVFTLRLIGYSLSP